jgi:hypothetical protein
MTDTDGAVTTAVTGNSDDLDLGDLDRLAVSLDYLALNCEPDRNERRAPPFTAGVQSASAEGAFEVASGN